MKAFGYQLARNMAAALPVRSDIAATHVGLRSKASTQTDIESDWAAYWLSQLGVPVLYHRKLWELAYVLQAIYEHGHLREGARGLGFGCGVEPHPSYLAARGVHVTATDLAADQMAAKGWIDSYQDAQSVSQTF